MYKSFIRLLTASGLAIALLVPGNSIKAVLAQGAIPEASDEAIAQEQAEEKIVEHLEGWEFQKGDWIYADVGKNTLQFVRADDSERSPLIRMGSGINNGKKVSYLGMRYDPKTPERTWEIRSKHQQNQYAIFGTKEAKEQLFLRLYEVKGDQRIATHYGIHTMPAIEYVFSVQKGFGSYGCLVTRYDLLKQIEELYKLNDEVVKVVTVRG